MLDAMMSGTMSNVAPRAKVMCFGMLFITHNLAVVRYVSDAIAVMENGRVVELGDTEQVTTTPQHAYTKRLLVATPLTLTHF
jgi:peptide/nickel transport system ATP-binding protein